MVDDKKLMKDFIALLEECEHASRTSKGVRGEESFGLWYADKLTIDSGQFKAMKAAVEQPANPFFETPQFKKKQTLLEFVVENNLNIRSNIGIVKAISKYMEYIK